MTSTCVKKFNFDQTSYLFLFIKRKKFPFFDYQERGKEFPAFNNFRWKKCNFLIHVRWKDDKKKKLDYKSHIHTIFM